MSGGSASDPGCGRRRRSGRGDLPAQRPLQGLLRRTGRRVADPLDLRRRRRRPPPRAPRAAGPRAPPPRRGPCGWARACHATPSSTSARSPPPPAAIASAARTRHASAASSAATPTPAAASAATRVASVGPLDSTAVHQRTLGLPQVRRARQRPAAPRRRAGARAGQDPRARPPHPIADRAGGSHHDGPTGRASPGHRRRGPARRPARRRPTAASAAPGTLVVAPGAPSRAAGEAHRGGVVAAGIAPTRSAQHRPDLGDRAGARDRRPDGGHGPERVRGRGGLPGEPRQVAGHVGDLEAGGQDPQRPGPERRTPAGQHPQVPEHRRGDRALGRRQIHVGPQRRAVRTSSRGSRAPQAASRISPGGSAPSAPEPSTHEPPSAHRGGDPAGAHRCGPPPAGRACASTRRTTSSSRSGIRSAATRAMRSASARPSASTRSR